MKVFAYVHTHWDREWYQPFEEYRLRLIELVDKLVDDLQSEKLNYFYFDGQTAAIEDYLEIFPEKEQLIKELVEKNKITMGPWYVLADEFLVSGESIIRNLLLGINKSKAFGCNDFVGYLPDAFGHIDNMPQIFSSFGIENTILWRGAGEQKSLFEWLSKDGSSVCAHHLIEGYFQDLLNQQWSTGKKAEHLKIFLDKIKKSTDIEALLLPIGADHLATAVNLMEQISKINENLDDYQIILSSFEEYFENIKAQKVNVKEIKGELRDNSRNFILSGTFSTRLYLKQQNARTGWLLAKIAEPLQSLLEKFEISSSRKNQLEYAWKLFLQNHPHDSICGCSVDSVHREMLTRYEKTNQVTNGVISRCLRDVSNRISKNEIAVFNLCDYPFEGVVKIKTDEKLAETLCCQKTETRKEFPPQILYDIQKIPVQEDYVSFHEYLVYVDSLKPYSLSIINPEKSLNRIEPVKTSQNLLKNKFVEIKVNKDGLLDIKNLENNLEFKNIHLFQDRADVGDTYNFNPIKNDKPTKARLKKVELKENGSLRGVLRLIYEMEIPEKAINETKRSKKTFKQIIQTDVVLYANSKMVEFETTWENKAKDHILQLKFNMPEKITKTISENNLGIIEREFDPDYSIKENMPVPFGKELKTNTACMQRFVWSQGFGLITEGLCEYGVDKNELYLTLIRSVGILSKGKIGTRGQAAGPPLPTPEAQCLGLQKARYAICLTEEPSELFAQADFFMGNILAQKGFAEKTEIKDIEFVKILNPNIYTYSIKKPHDKVKKGIIFRLMNISDKKQSLKADFADNIHQILEVNSLEETLSETNLKNTDIVFGSNELKTFWAL
jgi:alpha-mannosidase